MILRSAKAQQIADLESRLTLRNDEIEDYRRKLNGDSPDEAKARLDAMEAQLREFGPKLAALGPRFLTAEQQNTLTGVLSSRPAKVQISQDAATHDSKPFGRHFIAAFREAGWEVATATIVGVGFPPPTGVGLFVKNTQELDPEESAVLRACQAANVAIDVQPFRAQGSPVTLLITTGGD